MHVDPGVSESRSDLVAELFLDHSRHRLGRESVGREIEAQQSDRLGEATNEDLGAAPPPSLGIDAGQVGKSLDDVELPDEHMRFGRTAGPGRRSSRSRRRGRCAYYLFTWVDGRCHCGLFCGLADAAGYGGFVVNAKRARFAAANRGRPDNLQSTSVYSLLVRFAKPSRSQWLTADGRARTMPRTEERDDSGRPVPRCCPVSPDAYVTWLRQPIE
jgi:hypothetical protein